MIEYYEVEGRAKDIETVNTHRDEWERWMVGMLRDCGYIPVLELTSEWSVLYVEDDPFVHWAVRIPVVNIGEELSWRFSGAYGERLLPAHTRSALSRFGLS